jgi:hypothetical protein
MKRIREFIERLDNLDIESIAVDKAMKAIPRGLIASWSSGKRPDGRGISPPYAPSTVRYKKRKNQPYDRVTLKDSGDLYASLLITDSLEVKSEYYLADLKDRYGSSILGVSKTAKDEILDETKKTVRNSIFRVL